MPDERLPSTIASTDGSRGSTFRMCMAFRLHPFVYSGPVMYVYDK